MVLFFFSIGSFAEIGFCSFTLLWSVLLRFCMLTCWWMEMNIRGSTSSHAACICSCNWYFYLPFKNGSEADAVENNFTFHLPELPHSSNTECKHASYVVFHWYRKHVIINLFGYLFFCIIKVHLLVQAGYKSAELLMYRLILNHTSCGFPLRKNVQVCNVQYCVYTVYILCTIITICLGSRKCGFVPKVALLIRKTNHSLWV